MDKIKQHLFPCALLAALFPLFASCPIEVSSAVAVTNITGVPGKVTLDSVLVLSGMAEPVNAANRSIEWSIASSGGTGSTISGGNILTPRKVGTVRVMARIKDGSITMDYTQNFTVEVTTDIYYTVTYDINGGSGLAPIAQTAAAGNKLTLATADEFSKSGYDFVGWCTDKDGSGYTYTAGASFIPEASVILYAKWSTMPHYTLIYSTNGGSVAPARATVFYNSHYTLAVPLRNGSGFAGWYSDPDCTDQLTYANGVSLVPWADTNGATVYAKWVASYTVTYDTGGGSINRASDTVAMGVSYNLAVPTKPPYRFRGWYTAPNGTGNQLTRANGASVAAWGISAHTTAYARWEEPAVYVAYDINGGTGTTPPEIELTRGQQIYLSYGTLFLKSGYTFAGWNTNAAGTGTTYSPGALYTPLATITLWAKWLAQFTVTYNGNGGTMQGILPVTVTEGGEVIPPAWSGTVKPGGYLFESWNSEKDGTGVVYPAGVGFVPNKNMTLYARWGVKCTVTFDVNGGTGNAPAPEETVSQHYITLPEGPRRDGYTFMGWSTTKSSGGTRYPAGALFQVTQNVTLYAWWEPN